MLGVILSLAEHLHVESRVGGERVFELLERPGRGEFDLDRLKSVATLIGRLQNARVGPDLRFGGAAAGGEDTDNRPIALADAQFAAEFHPGKLVGGADAGNGFILAPFEHAPVHQL